MSDPSDLLAEGTNLSFTEDIRSMQIYVSHWTVSITFITIHFLQKIMDTWVRNVTFFDEQIGYKLYILKKGCI